MKKLLKQAILLSLIIGTGCFPVCTHIHNEECGRNGVIQVSAGQASVYVDVYKSFSSKGEF